jgi:hypothetical protein
LSPGKYTYRTLFKICKNMYMESRKCKDKIKKIYKGKCTYTETTIRNELCLV